MKKLLPSLILLLVTYTSLALGVGAWKNETPGGNIIDHDHWDNVTRLHLLTNDQKIDSIDGWYFYKNFIVGTSNNSSRYFVVEESKSRIKIFSRKEEWIQYLKINGLVPKVRTRWYYGDWEFNLNDLLGYLVSEFLFCLILSAFIVSLWFAYKRLRNQNIKLIRFYLFTVSITTICLWALTFAEVFLSKFPQSL